MVMVVVIIVVVMVVWGRVVGVVVGVVVRVFVGVKLVILIMRVLYMPKHACVWFLALVFVVVVIMVVVNYVVLLIYSCGIDRKGGSSSLTYIFTMVSIFHISLLHEWFFCSL